MRKQELEKKTLNVYHIAFSFDDPKPGVISIPAESAEEAKKVLLEMAKNMRNVTIVDIIDAAEVPQLQEMIERARNSAVEDAEIIEDDTKETIN